MYTEEEKQRIREFRARLYSLTGDANKVLSALESDPRGLWDAYLEQESGDGDLSDEVTNWILNTQRRLFPGRTLGGYTDVLVRLRHLIAVRLGQLDRDPDASDANID